MTLEPSTEPKQATQEKKQIPERKKDIALRIAQKYLDMPESEARNRVKEETPCSVSVAHYAVKQSRKLAAAAKGGTPEKPSIIIEKQDQALTPFIQGEHEEVITEEKEAVEPQLISAEQQEQLDIFRDMLRGVHVLLLSDEGLLGEKYGRKKDMCVQVSDQLYRWLHKRVGIEQLDKYDTLLLAVSYMSLVGGIAKDVITERRKSKATSEKKLSNT